MNILRVALLLLLAQNFRPIPASLEGTIVRAGTNDGLSKTIVELRRLDDPSTTPYFTTTVDDGRFSFGNLQPGKYQLSARRNGYVLTGAAHTLMLTAGERVTNVRIAMTLAGVIYGRVYDEVQRPLANAEVQAMEVAYEGGARVLKFVRSVTTNDLGEYRLFWLPPGQYYVSALHPDAGRYKPPGGISPSPFTAFMAWDRRSSLTPPLAKPRVGTYVPIFSPNSPDEQNAVSIDLSEGGDVGNVDITVYAIQMHSVRGVITDGTTGRPAHNASLFVFRIPARVNDNPYIGVNFSAGSFEVSSLLPGSYAFVATAEDLTGRALIEVADENVDDATIVLMPGSTISGRIITDSNRTSLADFRISLRPDPDIAGWKLPSPEQSGVPTNDGSFFLLAIPPGDYRLNVTVPPNLRGAYLKSARFGPVDILRDGLRITSQPAGRLEVVIGTNPGVVGGRIVTAKQEPVPGVTVVVLPQGDQVSRMDLFKEMLTDALGRYRFDGLAPGDYKIFARDAVDGSWTGAEFLSVHENQGTPIHIAEGASVSADIVLSVAF